jgi:hypothetical protein
MGCSRTSEKCDYRNERGRPQRRQKGSRNNLFVFFVVKDRHFAIKLPKLNVMAVELLFCLFQGLGVVDTIEEHGPVKMAIRTDDVNPIIDHATLPVSELAFHP